MHPQNVMKRRLFSLLLTLAMLLSLLPAAHALREEKLPDEDGYGYTYRFVTRDTIEITSYYGYESEVVVPATIDGYTVVGIQSFHATEGYSDPNVVVRKVTLPDTVTYIADDAFYDSDDWSAKTHSALHEIVLPQSLKTIGERAFYHNYYLEKITIPASVTEIGKAAFAACTNLSDITIQGEHTLLHGGAFGARTSYSVGTFAGQLSADFFRVHRSYLVNLKAVLRISRSSVTLEGGADMAITTGTFYQEPGYSALDNVDGDLTGQVQVDGEVDWLTPGTYSVTYTVTDGYENTTTATRTVEVKAVPRPEVVWPEGKVIYLTFDDGPGPYTEQLLDVLDSYGVKATFFVTNRGYGEMMKEIVDRGHSIGIHTMSHVYERIYASPEAYFADLLGMQDVIYQNTGVKTTLMRFPGGSSNTVSAHSYVGLMSLLTRAVQDAGFQYFDWNVDSNDAGGAKKAQTVFNNVTAGVSQNRVSVVLQHDIHDFSVDAVEDIIVWGLNNGYSFERLTENSPGVHHGVQN